MYSRSTKQVKADQVSLHDEVVGTAKKDSTLLVVFLLSLGVLGVVLFLAANPVTGIQPPLSAIPAIPESSDVEGTITLDEFPSLPAGGSVSLSYHTALIDEWGRFAFNSIQPGTYELIATYTGITMITSEISIQQGMNRLDLRTPVVVPGLMVRYIPDGTNPEEMYVPVRPKVYHRGNPSLKRIAITIDDGWSPDDRLLDLFERYGIRCTVFIIGGNGVGIARPEWIKRMDNMGFEVCNHTFTHPDLTKLTDARIEADIKQCQKVITDVTNKMYPWFRPPYRIFDQRVIDIAARCGLKTVLWSNDLLDTRLWMKKEDQIKSVMRLIKNGDIIISHFGAHNTYEVLETIIPELIARGYHIGTVSEVLAGLE